MAGGVRWWWIAWPSDVARAGGDHVVQESRAAVGEAEQRPVEIVCLSMGGRRQVNGLGHSIRAFGLGGLIEPGSRAAVDDHGIAERAAGEVEIGVLEEMEIQRGGRGVLDSDGF